MKKLILAISAAAIVATVSAQAPREQKFSESQRLQTPNMFQKHNSQMGKADLESWYSYVNWLYSPNVPYSAGMKGYVDFLYHDSLAKSTMIFQSGEQTMYGFGKISAGTVLDPKDDIMDLTDDASNKLTKHVGYQVDSVHFVYRYVRQVDSLSDGVGGKIPVVDTLFVTYFKGNQISKSSLIFTGPPKDTVNYANVKWQGGNIRMPKNYFDMDTILLTINDTTTVRNNNGGFENSWTVRDMTLAAPAGLSSAPDQNDNLVSFTLTFKSAVPTVVGTDTAYMVYQKDPATLPSGSRRTNYFGYNLYANEGGTPWENPKFFNTSIFVESISAYTPWVLNASVIFDGYWPGMIYRPKEYFTSNDYYIKSNTDNIGINEIKNEAFALSNLYPNPARVGENPVMAFNLAKTATVSVSIINVLGQEVKAASSKRFESGIHTEFVDITGLKSGVYFVNMTVNGSTISKKLNIVE